MKFSVSIKQVLLFFHSSKHKQIINANTGSFMFYNLVFPLLLSYLVKQKKTIKKTKRQFESRLRTAHSRSGYVRWGGGGCPKPDFAQNFGRLYIRN